MKITGNIGFDLMRADMLAQDMFNDIHERYRDYINNISDTVSDVDKFVKDFLRKVEKDYKKEGLDDEYVLISMFSGELTKHYRKITEKVLDGYSITDFDPFNLYQK